MLDKRVSDFIRMRSFKYYSLSKLIQWVTKSSLLPMMKTENIYHLFSREVYSIYYMTYYTILSIWEVFIDHLPPKWQIPSAHALSALYILATPSGSCRSGIFHQLCSIYMTKLAWKDALTISSILICTKCKCFWSLMHRLHIGTKI